MNKVILSIKFDIEDLLNKNYNNTVFSKEAIESAKNSLKDTPFISYDKDGNESPIGIIQDYSNGFLWVEANPEYIINDYEVIDGVTHIKDFSYSAISMSFNVSKER